MLFLIGGCSRSGKTTLATLLLREAGISFFSTDWLDAALVENGQLDPEANDNGAAANQEVQRLLRPMVSTIKHSGGDYTFEGIHLAPSFIRELKDAYLGFITACVLGFPDSLPTPKTCNWPDVACGTADWLQQRSSVFQVSYLEKQQRISQQIQAECYIHSIPFIDTGFEFCASIRRARMRLLDGTLGSRQERVDHNYRVC